MIRATLSFIAMAALGSAIKSTLVDTQVVLSPPSNVFGETCQKIASSISAASNVYDFRSLLCPPLVESVFKHDVYCSIGQLPARH